MTAIEWLVHEIIRNNFNVGEKMFEQAKEMEKQQTVDAYSHGWHDGQDVIIAQVKHIDKGGEVAGNEYYNETKGGAK
jgi:hypothetical protein